MGNSNSSRDTTTAANDDDPPSPPHAFDYYDDVLPVSAGDGPARPISVFEDPFRRSSPVSLLGKRSSQTETIWGERATFLGRRCSPATMDRPRGRDGGRVADSATAEALAKMHIEEALARAVERSPGMPRATDSSAMDMDRLQKIFNGTFGGDSDSRKDTEFLTKMRLEEKEWVQNIFNGSDGENISRDTTAAEALEKMQLEGEAAASRQLEEALARAPPGIQRLREMLGYVVRRNSVTTVAPDTDTDTDQLAVRQLLAAAEDLWASGQLESARRLVRMAMDLEPFSGFPEVRRAQAAYDVLAASSKSNGKADHDYVVLGVAVPPCGCRIAHADVKARYEELCALFDPDKTGDNSLAVACALHLVNLAFDRITDTED